MLQQRYSEELKSIEGALMSALGEPAYDGLGALWQSMRYSLLSGGKRFRPLLSLLTARALEKNYEQAIPIAVAVEMVHTYSLIHDDLPVMDNDDFRRGQPTNHKVYGDALALLAGDGLLTKAFGVLALAESGQVLAAISRLSQAAGPSGMVGGQVLDIGSGPEIEIGYLQRVHQLKTGALISVSVTGAALLCDASPKQLVQLEKFGDSLGFAFQLADDIQDHNEENPEKASFTSKLGIEKTKDLLRQASDQATRALETFGPAAAELRQMIDINLNRIQ